MNPQRIVTKETFRRERLEVQFPDYSPHNPRYGDMVPEIQNLRKILKSMHLDLNKEGTGITGGKSVFTSPDSILSDNFLEGEARG